MRPPSRITHSFSVTAANITISDIALKLYSLGYICHRQYRCIFNHFYAMRPGSYWIRWNDAKSGLLRRSRLF